MVHVLRNRAKPSRVVEFARLFFAFVAAVVVVIVDGGGGELISRLCMIDVRNRKVGSANWAACERCRTARGRLKFVTY